MIERLEFPSEERWLGALTDGFLALSEAVLERRPFFHVALAGGGTPRPWYERLGRLPLRWDRIHWWLADERWVPPDHPDSNERMVRETLGAARTEFAANFHSWHRAEDPARAAERIAAELRRALGERPSLDLAVLGVGEDGHTASLFPGHPALEERGRDAAAVGAPPQGGARVTFTYPLLDRAAAAWFLVRGKAETVRRLLQGDPSLPAARLKTAAQRLYWLNAAPAPPADSRVAEKGRAG